MTTGQVDRIGPYRVLGTVGRGGMGTVVAAEDPKLGRPVAIKVLDTADPDLAARLRTEAQLMADLQHPHLLPILDIGEEESGLYLVMPYMAGGSLADLVDGTGPLTPGQVATVLVAVAAALGAMHTRSVIHRDLKPSNVLLSAEGDVYLADLGLAWMTRSARHTTTGAFSGTLGFAAPELLEGGDPTPLTDTYTLGVLGYYLLTGSEPFGGDSMASVVRKVCAGDHPPLLQVAPSLPAPLAVAVETAMDPDPTRRPASLPEWGRAVALAAPPEPLIPPPPAPLSPHGATAAVPVSLRICPRCGAEAPTTAESCPTCGQDLTLPFPPAPQTVTVAPAVTEAAGPAHPPAPPHRAAVADTVLRGNIAAPLAATEDAIRVGGRRALPVLIAASALAGMALVVVAVVLLAGAGGSGPAAGDAAAPAGSAGTVAMLGYATDGPLGFTPSGFSCGVTVANLIPTGKFCRLDLKVRNVDDTAARTFVPAAQELRPGGGAPVPLHATATQLSDPTTQGLATSIPPGGEVAAVLLWDAPAAADPDAMHASLHAEAGSPGLDLAARTTPATPPPSPATGAVLSARVARTCGANGRGDCFLSVRAAPTSASTEIARRDEAATVGAVCQVQGEQVRASVHGQATTVWVRDDQGHYMSAAYLDVPGWDPFAITVPC